MPPVKLLCKVVSNELMTPTVFLLKFTTEPVFDFIAGQFISIVIPGAGPEGRDLRRAYSISSPPEQKQLELCIKLVPNGPGSNYLKNLTSGAEFSAMAPYGAFVSFERKTKGAMFISTGTGLSPFRSILRSSAYKAKPALTAYNLFGVHSEDEVLFPNELQSNGSTVKNIICVSKPTSNWAGFKGRVTDYLRSFPEDFKWTELEYYLCGNGAMIEEVKLFLFERGLEKGAVHQEVYYRPKNSEE